MTYEDFLEEWHNEKDFCVVHTSGSTGEPKNIRLPKSLMQMSALRTIDFFGLSPCTHIHSCLSPEFIGGKMMAVRAVAGNLRLTWEKPSNQPEVISLFPYDVPRLVSLVPSQIVYILNHHIPEVFYRTIWLLGGSPIESSLRKKIAQSGLEVWESYGMTETSSHIALRKVKSMPGPFYPLSGVTLSADKRGCLIIAQHGYEITTNDMVSFFPDGGFLITGRADNIIITGGKKIQPEKIESLLENQLREYGVNALMISSSPDEKWGEKVILLMELSKECTLSQDKLVEIAHEICKNNLQPYEVPKEFRIVARLPRTPNGKLRRK